ncbi:hypothetical protein [Actinomadura madurae]|uniref:hypothetical protein n=1 Tax=Actinomadura madurae TaxID=1993 RepID=UPI0020D23E08|nr:hypothetical protein [Actinomadura madurae]MCQ0004160.1 hypothetical protein [Actinomadura madurae]
MYTGATRAIPPTAGVRPAIATGRPPASHSRTPPARSRPSTIAVFTSPCSPTSRWNAANQSSTKSRSASPATRAAPPGAGSGASSFPSR